MRVSERQDIANRVVHFYVNKAKCNKYETVGHFLSEGHKKSTIYGIIKRYERTGTSEYRPKSGRIATKTTPKTIKKVQKFLVNTNWSERKVAQKVGISDTTVHRIKSKLGIKTRKCQSVPKYVNNQAKRAKTNCRKLYRNSTNKIFIIDDETYVMIDPKNIPGSKYFNFIDKNSVPNEVRFKPKEKFAKKFLVWQAMDQFGNVSEPYIKTGTMNAKEYLEECLQKRLLPFILKYHKITDVVFWPDLAPIHYEKNVIKWLKTKNISFVEKENNPPAVPQARPIEVFWALCKEKYGQRSVAAKSLRSFKKIWLNISKDIARTSAQSLMKNMRKRLKDIGNHGVYHPFVNK